MKLDEFFSAIGEPFAAGYFRSPNDSYVARHAHALAKTLATAPLPDYHGTRLYPQGHASVWDPGFNSVFRFHYPHSVALRGNPVQACLAKAEKASIPVSPVLRSQIEHAAQDKAFTVSFLRGWTHSVLHYERIIRDGLARYAERLEDGLADSPEFCAPLLEVLRAIQTHIRRCETFLRAQNAGDLADIFARMATRPAETLRQALVYVNYFWFIDDPDSLGRFDAILDSFPKTLSDDELTGTFRELWQSFDALSVWHVTFDSHLSWLHPALQAQRGLSRPGSSVLIDDTTPDDAWDAIFDSWASGSTNPSLYYRPNYDRHLDTLWNVRPEDFCGLSYGGCTELMIMGKSNVGSTDGQLNALHVLTAVPLDASSFDDFYQTFLRDIRQQAKEEVDRCELGHQVAAMYQPNLIRTLFTDDCIDRRTEFNAGGARYNLGLIGVEGLTNTVNALANIQLAFRGQFPLTRLRDALDQNFENDPELLAQLRKTPKFGNDLDAVDTLATRVINDIFDIVRAESRPGRTYLPFINLFTTYTARGAYVPASADGRLAGEPVGDSFGAVQGTDLAGPTALINSVTKPDQFKALGTPTFNIRFRKDMLETPEARRRTRALIETYFRKGGLQIQVSVLDAASMKHALEHPEAHAGLMVRIGGYSEYFTRLSKAVQLEVIKRTEHALD